MPVGKNLISRLVRRGFVNQLVLAALLFISAGSLKFWQGWVFMVLNLIAGLCSCIYFYKHDLQLLERRMLKKEKISEQRLIMTLWKVLAAVSIVLSGYDYQFGWSRTFPGPVPLWLTLLALLLVLGGHVLFFQVLKANRFAASIIQVEAGQAVVATGPYRFVRHPMYSAGVIIWLCTPLALGSYAAVPVCVLIIPAIIFRLLNEEKVLRQELPGYSEYCRRTRFRLVPFVW